MRRWLLLAVLAAPLVVPVATPGAANACSCAFAPDDPRILQPVAHAEGVFTGTATAKRIDGDTAYYEFDVREVFTGKIGDSTVVATSTQGPACGTGYATGTADTHPAGNPANHERRRRYSGVSPPRGRPGVGHSDVWPENEDRLHSRSAPPHWC